MASLTKINLDQFSLTNNKYSSSSSNKPSFSLSNENTAGNEHKILINQISMKNSALAQHNGSKKSNTHHPNYLTFCQQYADMLCQKYNSSHNTTATSSVNLKPIRQQSSSSDSSVDETITKSMILYKRYFQTIQFDFEKDVEELLVKLKHLNSVLKTRNQTFVERDLKVEEELEVMEIFMIGINRRMCRQSVTPFAVFVEEISREKQKKGKTPERVTKQKHTKKSPSYEQADFIKHDSPFNQNKHSKTRSFIVNPHSPDLLQSFNDQYNNHQNSNKSPENESSKNMFVSFNLFHQNQTQQKNPNLSNGGDTLKYSESEFNHHLEEEMRISLERSMEGKEVETDEVNERELPFSPVQPYRLHKLYDERNLKKLTKDQENTHKTAKQSAFMSPDHEDLSQLLPLVQQFKGSIKQSLEPNFSSCKKLNKSLTHSASEFCQLFQKSASLISEQKYLLNEQWNDIVDCLGKDIQQLQSVLVMEKAENDMKDKKFLQNLEVIQSELIEELFGEKELRKAQQAVLTQVLTNLVDSLQNGGE